VAAREQRAHGHGRTGEQRVTILCARDAPLEQLAHHSKRELDLELGSARTQNLMTEFRRTSARRCDQCRLAKTDAPLDEEDFARDLEECLNRSKFTLPFEQLHLLSLLEDARLAKGPGSSRFAISRSHS
jgi:hypothetical protein